MLRRLATATAGLALIRYHRTSSDVVDNDANMKSEQPWWFVIEIDASYLECRYSTLYSVGFDAQSLWIGKLPSLSLC